MKTKEIVENILECNRIIKIINNTLNYLFDVSNDDEYKEKLYEQINYQKKRRNELTNSLNSSKQVFNN